MRRKLKIKKSRSRRNPVPASHHLEKIEQAARLYEQFTGHEAKEALRYPKPKIPRELVAIGLCDGIMYTTRRDGKVEKYLHKFRAKSRPLLAVSHDGTSAWLLGGAYHFTERGFEDR